LLRTTLRCRRRFSRWCDLGSDEAWVAADAASDEKALIAAAVKGDGAKLIKCYSADQETNPDGYSADIMSGTLAPKASRYYIVGLYVPENANLTYDITSPAPQLNVTFRLRSSQIIEEEKTVTSPESTTIPAVYAPLPWDGVSKKAVTAQEGVFSVSSAEELAWVISYFSGSNVTAGAYTVNLTDNIELNNKPITLNALNASVTSLTVNGSGYKIYNLNMRTSDTSITVQKPMLFTSGNNITYSEGLFSGVTVTTP